MRVVLEAEPDRVLVGLRRLAAGDVDRVAGRAERRDELAERGVEVRRASAISFRPLSTHGVGQQHARAAGAGDDHDVLALGRRQDRHAARELEHLAQRPRADHAGLPQHVVVDLVVAGERAGVRAGRLRAQPTCVRPSA